MVSHQNDTNKDPCQLCGQQPLQEFVVQGKTMFWKCDSCGLYQYGIAPPAASHDNEAYHASYRDNYHRKLRTANVRLSRIAPLTQSATPRVLDIGCGIGAVLDAAQRRGWQATGVDVSRTAAKDCREHGLDCREVDGWKLPFEDDEFDIVTAWSVIEHVDDVAWTLEEWGRVLRPGGVLAMDTSDASCLKARLLGANYRGIWVNGHTYTFTRATLRAFAQRAGFQVLRKPFVGRISQLPLGTACYALAYQAQYQLRDVLRIQKPFQIYLRKAANAASHRTRAA